MLNNSKSTNSKTREQNLAPYLETDNTKFIESQEKTQIYKKQEESVEFVKSYCEGFKNTNYGIISFTHENSEEEISKKQKEEEFQIKQMNLNEIAKNILENPLPNLLIEKEEWDLDDLNYPIFGSTLPDEKLKLKQDNFKIFRFLFHE